MFRRTSRIFWWLFHSTMFEPMLIPDGDGDDDGPVPPKEPPPKDGFNPAFFRPDRPRRRFEHRDRHHRHDRYERRGRDRFRDRSRSREASWKLWGWNQGLLAFGHAVERPKKWWMWVSKAFGYVILYDCGMLCTDQVEWNNFVKRDLPQFILRSPLGTLLWYDIVV